MTEFTSSDYSPEFCLCVCVWGFEAYQPYSTLEAGPAENRFPADKQGAAWVCPCVFVILGFLCIICTMAQPDGNAQMRSLCAMTHARCVQ